MKKSNVDKVWVEKIRYRQRQNVAYGITCVEKNHNKIGQNTFLENMAI